MREADGRLRRPHDLERYLSRGSWANETLLGFMRDAVRRLK
jgi:hypothetical protein